MNIARRGLYPIIMMVFLITPAATGQEVIKMSLRDAVNYAYDNNLTLKNAKLNLLDAEQQIIERRSIGLPQLSAGANFQRYLEVPKQPLPQAFIDFLEQINPGEEIQREASFFLKNNFTASLDLDAMVFDGTFFVGLQAARAFREYTAQELTVENRNIRNQVIDAFLPVLLLNETMEILQKNINNLTDLLNETTQLYQSGFAEQLDIDRQQLSLTNLQTEYDNALRQKEVAMARLKYVIGYPVEEPLELSDELEEMVVVASEADLNADIDFQARPEYVLTEKGMELSDLNVRLNRAAYLPTLYAFGSYQQNYQGNDRTNDFWAPASFVGLRLNVPLFDGLNKQARVQRARIDMEKNQNQQTDLKRAIRLEITNARTLYINAREKLESQKENMGLAQRIYDTTQIKYREGVGSSVELTQAEQELYTAQANYIEALYNLLVAKVDLETALGK